MASTPTKVILLNGPPGCGKDIGTSFLCEQFGGEHQEFKKKLYELVMCIYSVPASRFWEIYNNRELKEKPLEEFEGLSVRQAMIKVSEEAIKPVYGKEYFGIAAARALKEGSVNVFSDSGFIEELNPLIRKVGKENILLLRIFRPGCSFEGDSRNYLGQDAVLNYMDIQNNSDIAAYQRSLVEWTRQFLNSRNYNADYPV